MIMFIALRYSFSKSAHHRSRAIRIVISTALSLAVLMVTISVMDYLQEGRLDRIRQVSSFDITLDGDHRREMQERYPDSIVFMYGETEALGSGSVFTVRFIDDDYSGGITIEEADDCGIIVPYFLYFQSGGSLLLTMLEEGRSGRLFPQTENWKISGAFYSVLGSSFDNQTIFIPISLMPEGIPIFTAIRNIDASEMEKLRGDGYSGESWKEKEAGLYSAFIAEKAMMYIVLSLLFVIILVSAKGSVREFFSSREKERAELMVLGLERRRADAAFVLASVIVMCIGILLGFSLSHVLIPLGEAYAFSILSSEAGLSFPCIPFLVFSLILLLFTSFFAMGEARNSDKKPIAEVLANE